MDSVDSFYIDRNSKIVRNELKSGLRSLRKKSKKCSITLIIQ